MASDQLKLCIHTLERPDSGEEATSGRASAAHRRDSKLRFQERMLRNSCLACAALLGILALGNIQQPWAIKASSAVEKALTMEIDLDESLGQLSFVQRLMPESALVFFNLDSGHALAAPVEGELLHLYSADQPWLMFSAEAGTSVRAARDGTVAAVSPMSGGGWGVLIDHGEGLESVTACLADVSVQAGDSIARGSKIGTADENVYFELRQSSEATDPTELLGL